MCQNLYLAGTIFATGCKNQKICVNKKNFKIGLFSSSLEDFFFIQEDGSCGIFLPLSPLCLPFRVISCVCGAFASNNGQD